jgi:hypothetical protein
MDPSALAAFKKNTSERVEGGYRCFNLISLSYEITPSSTYGLLLYDKELETVYNNTKNCAIRDPKHFKSWIGAPYLHIAIQM